MYDEGNLTIINLSTTRAVLKIRTVHGPPRD